MEFSPEKERAAIQNGIRIPSSIEEMNVEVVKQSGFERRLLVVAPGDVVVFCSIMRIL